MRSYMTDRLYIVTRYKELGEGRFMAQTKHEVNIILSHRWVRGLTLLVRLLLETRISESEISFMKS